MKRRKKNYTVIAHVTKSDSTPPIFAITPNAHFAITPQGVLESKKPADPIRIIVQRPPGITDSQCKAFIEHTRSQILSCCKNNISTILMDGELL